jgi:hypothetical protein
MALGMPVEQGFRMAAAVEIPRADEKEELRICACANRHAG